MTIHATRLPKKMNISDDALQMYQDEITHLLEAYRKETLSQNVRGSLPQLITRLGIPFEKNNVQATDQPAGSETIIRKALCDIVDITPNLAGVDAQCHDAIVQALWSTTAWRVYLASSKEPWRLAAILVSNVGYMATGKDSTQRSTMDIVLEWTGLNLNSQQLLPESRVELLCERLFGDIWWCINPVISAEAGPRVVFEQPPFLPGLTNTKRIEKTSRLPLPEGLG